MAPRKKAKASAASTPLTETQPKTPQETGPHTQSSPHNENSYNDAWTDDQETQLFKSMMKWKPTGMATALNLYPHLILLTLHRHSQTLSHGCNIYEYALTRIRYR